MRYLGKITDNKDLTTKEYVDGKVATVRALKEMKSSWLTGATAEAAEAILEDADVSVGDGFIGDVEWSDLPTGMLNAECKAFVVGDGIVQFEITSSSNEPYAWFYNSAASTWRGYVPIENSLTSTSTTAALSANQGKELKSLLDNTEDWVITFVDSTTETHKVVVKAS